MIEKNKIKHMRSEAARAGYFDLPMAPLAHHAKGTIKKSYIVLKEKTEKKIRSLRSLKDSFKSVIENSNQQIQERKLDIIDVMCASILLFVIGTILILWKDLIMAPISVEYLVPIGFMIAGATIGGIYSVVQTKQGKPVSIYVEYGIVGFVTITTFLFSLQSSEQIFLIKSAVVAGFVGLIVFITNKVVLPTFKNSIQVFGYVKDIILLSLSKMSLVIVKAVINKHYSTIKNTHRKMIQEINEVESLLIVDFMLGKEAKQNTNASGEIESNKELHYAS